MTALRALFADWRYGSLLVLVFCLPVLLGDVGTALIMAIAVLLAMSVIRARKPGLPDLAAEDWLFVGAFVLMAIAFAGSANAMVDARFAFNFAPLLLALPVARVAGNRAPGANLTGISVLAAAGSLLAVVIAVIQVLFLDAARAGGHVINAIHFANIAVTLGLLALMGMFTSHSRWRYALLMAPAAALAACVLSASRGPILAAIALGPLFLCLLWFQSRRAAAITAAALALIGLCAGLVIATFADDQIDRIASMVTVILDAVLTGETADRSTNVRLGLFTAGWSAFQDSLLFGHGWERIVPASYPYLEPPVQNYLDRRNFTYLHNDILDFAAGAGIFGLVAYFTMIAAPVAGVLTAPRDKFFLGRLYGALALSAGFLIFGLTSRLMGHALQLTLFAMMTVVIIHYARPTAATRSGAGATP